MERKCCRQCGLALGALETSLLWSFVELDMPLCQFSVSQHNGAVSLPSSFRCLPNVQRAGTNLYPRRINVLIGRMAGKCPEHESRLLVCECVILTITQYCANLTKKQRTTSASKSVGKASLWKCIPWALPLGVGADRGSQLTTVCNRQHPECSSCMCNAYSCTTMALRIITRSLSPW